MKRPATVKIQVSSGGVIFRCSGNLIEVALVAVSPVRKKLSNGVKNKAVWCLPKGIIDKKEDSQATALREVKEETGLSGEIIDKIGKIFYWYFVKDENTKFHKTVHFYLMKYMNGSINEHDWEVADAQWFSVDEAIDKLAYKGEKEILQKAKKMIEKSH